MTNILTKLLVERVENLASLRDVKLRDVQLNHVPMQNLTYIGSVVP